MMRRSHDERVASRRSHDEQAAMRAWHGRRRSVWIAVSMLALATPPVSAQSRVRAEVDTTLVTVGDRVTLTVSVEHPTGAVVEWPDSLALDPFEVLDANVLPSRSEESGGVSAISLSLAAFELGELEIPSFEVVVVRTDGEREVLATDRFAIEVVSVGTDETGDIRDIRGPLGIAVSILWLLLAAILVLIPALLAYLLYRRFRPGSDTSTSGTRGPPPRPAHELALEALLALEASPLLERGEVKEYHIRASEILRTYVERRFRVDALEMTTFEVVRALDAAGVDASFRDGLRSFLDQCDLVKFAKARPDARSSAAVVQLGRRLVEDTIPAVPVPDVDMPTEDGDREREGRGGGERDVGAGGAGEQDGDTQDAEPRGVASGPVRAEGA
jgi:hypothetical protein